MGTDYVDRVQDRLHAGAPRGGAPQQERNTDQGGQRPVDERVKTLEREVRERRKADEILHLASALFA